jgi:hypothetical protein
MCGIIGAAGKIPNNFTDKTFKNFLDTCASRGRDSTGVVHVSKDQTDYTFVKQIGSPSYLYDSKQYDKHIDKTVPSILIGHCRAKTVGDVNIRDAHPFDFPDRELIGVHNGTLQGYTQLPSYESGMIDSEALIASLAVATPKEVFPKVKGAFAVVWWDGQSKQLNFIRNDQRPLWFTWDKDLTMMLWASETWMFGAVEREIELWKGSKDTPKFVEIPVNTLWSFTVNALATKAEPTILMHPPVLIEPELVLTQPYKQPSYYDSWHNLKTKKGGEVVNPFLEKVRKAHPNWGSLSITKRLGLIQKFQDLTKEKLTPSPLKGVEFLQTSLTTTASKTASKLPQSSSKNTLSLPSTNSKSCPMANNVLLFENSKKLQTPYLKIKLKNEGVSVRKVAGMTYITDNKTGQERSFVQFIKDTDGECVFCKTRLESPKNIGEIITETTYLCKDCLTIDNINTNYRTGVQ